MCCINTKTSTSKKISMVVIFSIGAFVYFVYNDFDRIQTHLSVIPSSPDNYSFGNEDHAVESSFPGWNSTHLWSLRFADRNYVQLARRLPCLIVRYSSSPSDNTIDSCDHSSTYEYSRESILRAQKWIYAHQHPADCTNKRFAIIQHFASSGFGSTMHQIISPFGRAIADNRIAVYRTPGNWMYGNCKLDTPDCFFLPLTNCSIPSIVDGNQTILLNANGGGGPRPAHPVIFQNRTFNWYRTQLLFYLMRYKPETLTRVQTIIGQYLKPPSIDLQHPFIAVYVRRSDKVQNKEMSHAYALKEYFDLFDADAQRAKIRTVYINSEDRQVFDEFKKINEAKQGYYKLLSINTTRNVVYRSLRTMSKVQRGKIVLEFLSDLFIEVNADLHAGTLTSNWCRLVDEIRLALGKTIPYYTPEKKFLMAL